MIPNHEDTAAREESLLAYATRLAGYLQRTYYPNAINWKPLDTVKGVLTQIDNMISGLPAPATSPSTAISATPTVAASEPTELLRQVRDAIEAERIEFPKYGRYNEGLDTAISMVKQVAKQNGVEINE